jgi:cell division protein FtsA
VTSDIARGLTTSLADAERLKTLYGNAMATLADENEVIDVPMIGEDDRTHPNHVPRSLLVGIIQPRLEEILELTRARLNESGVGSVAGRRVVLTGGASQIPGLRDLAQLVLDKQVRQGRPIRVNGLAEAVNGRRSRPQPGC